MNCLVNAMQSPCYWCSNGTSWIVLTLRKAPGNYENSALVLNQYRRVLLWWWGGGHSSCYNTERSDIYEKWREKLLLRTFCRKHSGYYHIKWTYILNVNIPPSTINRTGWTSCFWFSAYKSISMHVYEKVSNVYYKIEKNKTKSFS